MIDTGLLKGDTKSSESKVPFLKAKDIRKEWDSILTEERGNGKPAHHAEIVAKGDALLHRVLASLSKGRADDQKAVAQVGHEVLESGLYGRA